MDKDLKKMFEESQKLNISSILNKGHQERIEYIAEKEGRKAKLSKIDLKLKTWRLWTFWPLIVIALGSALYSGYDFFIETPSIEKDMQILNKSNKQLESELLELRTLILSQKHHDSLLHIKNDRNNIENKRKI